jgi:hypothetical protein
MAEEEATHTESWGHPEDPGLEVQAQTVVTELDLRSTGTHVDIMLHARHPCQPPRGELYSLPSIRRRIEGSKPAEVPSRRRPPESQKCIDLELEQPPPDETADPWRMDSSLEDGFGATTTSNKAGLVAGDSGVTLNPNWAMEDTQHLHYWSLDVSYQEPAALIKGVNRVRYANDNDWFGASDTSLVKRGLMSEPLVITPSLPSPMSSQSHFSAFGTTPESATPQAFQYCICVCQLRVSLLPVSLT